MIEWNLASLGFVGIYLFQLAFAIEIELLNRRRLRESGNAVPDCMKAFIDEQKLASISAYSIDRSRIFLIQKISGDLILLVIVLSGLLTWINGFFASLNFLLAGLGFFLLLGSVSFLLELPFDYYDTFVLEEKYGFNRSDFRTWITDNLKASVVSAILLVITLAPLLWTIHVSPHHWWLLGFLLVALIQFLLVVLYPLVIAPLFNKFEPLHDRELAQKVERLVQETGMRTEGIFQMDAGKRSGHSNAYFTGFGKSKRIVLFDTLIGSHTHDEILAVLAHELGHFKLRHVAKTYMIGLAAMLAGFYFTYLLLNWPPLDRTFNFDPGQYHVALFLVSVFWRKLAFFLRPLAAWVSRRFERSADEFAADLLGNPQPLTTALKKLASYNLSNLNPHPFYVWFYYSHPPLRQRLEHLESTPGIATR
ncbi:MAG: M48 family metallopeptidase [Desulfomonile tiedjei]|uniref:M48 family metallopeptidase n=1 Tax=Desulfomonile tiedjei TaxID=2358 RepID=A0A9D6V3X1_9BACT|nr:M48 family metallopeptidase [Desulfomonile tiedjei]